MTEIFRIFKLGLNQDYLREYIEVGKKNFQQSMAKELGTMAMYASHVIDDTSQQIVVERYASDAAYQEHIASPHFKAFASLAQKAVINREVITLIPELFLQKNGALRIFEENTFSIRLATVQVSDNQAFSDIVLPEMKMSMEKEVGVRVMYAGRSIDCPDTWYFFEVYENDKAYERHCQTPHFKDYIERNSAFLMNKQLQVLKGEILVNRE